MKEMTKIWRTPTGVKVEVTGTLSTEKEINLDGHKSIVPECEITIDVLANGRSQGNWVRELSEAQKTKYPEYTHRVGSLALTHEQVIIIEEVEMELKREPEWVTEQAKIAQNKEDIAYYGQHGYGWCDKCRSYCYGDCEA